MLKKDWAEFLLLLLIFLSIPLFFYKLGQSSLASWDEAWYAEISRNILKSGDFYNMTWDNEPYFDHPPVGFFLMAGSFKLFGVSEFSDRLPSALFGIFSMVALYFLGKELFNRTVGLLSTAALPSAFWFLYRSRLGDLDIFLTFFFLASLFLAIKSSKSAKFLIPFSVALSLLFLTKTAIPLTIIPALVVIFWKAKIKRYELRYPLLVFILVVGSWFVVQYNNFGVVFWERYFSVGLPGVENHSNYLDNFKTIKELLHNGVGKWFWPGIAAIFGGLLTRKKEFLILGVFFLSFFVPFIFSSQGGIWHLIPLHPILIISFFGFSYFILEKFLKNPILRVLPLIVVLVYVSFLQIRYSWYQFINIPPDISDEAILSKYASTFSQDLFIEGSDFRPVAVFYSKKFIPQRLYNGELKEFFANRSAFLVITYQRELDAQGVNKKLYKVLKISGDKELVFRE